MNENKVLRKMSVHIKDEVDNLGYQIMGLLSIVGILKSRGL